MAGRTRLDGARILLVDDDEDTRTMYDLGLGHLGARIVAVPSSAEALDAFRRGRPDALVSDLALESVDGYGLLRTIRALEPAELVPLPAVAVSGWGHPSAREEAIAAGFDEYCVKPCSPDDLAMIVARLLRRVSLALRERAEHARHASREQVLRCEAQRREIYREAERRRRKTDPSR